MEFRCWVGTRADVTRLCGRKLHLMGFLNFVKRMHAGCLARLCVKSAASASCKGLESDISSSMHPISGDPFVRGNPLDVVCDHATKMLRK